MKLITLFCLISLQLFTNLFVSYNNLNRIKIFETTNNSALLNKVDSIYPFGCKVIETHKFPKFWKTDSYDNFPDPLPHEVEFSKIINYFNDLNSSKNITGPINIKTISYLSNLKTTDSLAKIQTKSLLKKGNYKKKLWKINIYECYYFYVPSKKNNGGYGYIMFYNPLIKTAQLLNVFFELTGDQNTSFRYFYMNEQKNFKIFEGSCYDDGCSNKLYNYKIALTANLELEIINN